MYTLLDVTVLWDFLPQIISIQLHHKIKDQSKLIIQKWHLPLIHYL